MFDSGDGTWDSIGWWLMMSQSERFLREYIFKGYLSRKPNFDALAEKFPEVSGLNQKEIGEVMLDKYVKHETTLKEIEECLNKLSNWEQLLLEIQKAVVTHSVIRQYGDQYPIFAEKVINNVVINGVVNPVIIEKYLKRQLEYYDQLISSQKIEPVSGEWLNMIEAALRYRKSLKAAEKEANKEKRKAKKSKI